MKMKTIAYLLLGFSAFTLVACSLDKKAKESSKTSGSTSVQTKEHSVNQQIENQAEDKKTNKNQKDGELSYNGSYYSLQGKYEEILIVNKKYPLSSHYNPGENPTAKAALLKLIADMKAAGYALSDQYSGFRSYDTQLELYQNYVDRDGKEAADRYSARPGYSEHQSGLAFDLIDTEGNLLEEPGASQWLLDNAANYGFIVRFLKGKETSTGYMPESWHLRYIGREAKEIADSGKSLEEYFGISGGNYQD